MLKRRIGHLKSEHFRPASRTSDRSELEIRSRALIDGQNMGACPKSPDCKAISNRLFFKLIPIVICSGQLKCPKIN